MNDFIEERNAQIQALADSLVRTRNVYDLATELATYKLREREIPRSKIPVTQEEFDQICNLFRVKGVRANGEVETRGRKRQDSI